MKFVKRRISNRKSLELFARFQARPSPVPASGAPWTELCSQAVFYGVLLCCFVW